MKKLVLLPLFALLIASCSTDDISSDIQESQLAASEAADAERGGFPELPEPPVFVNSCFDHAEATVTLNLPSGLGGTPDLVFQATTYGAGSSAYNVRFEVETLVDCEDIELGTGDSNLFYLGNFVDLDQSSPTITLKPYDLPADCYRWRFVFEKKNAGRYPCTSYTPWYDAPLY